MDSRLACYRLLLARFIRIECSILVWEAYFDWLGKVVIMVWVARLRIEYLYETW